MLIKSISCLAIVAATALVSIPAYSQVSATDASSPAPTKKEMRAKNRALEKAIRKNFSKNNNLDSTGIFIIPRNGIVSLAGDVPEASQIEIAGQIAAATPGVTHVNNKISLRYPGN
jgi:hyperosmotically inducible periplasmic protein